MKIKKIVLFVFISVFLSGKLFAEINDGLLITVGNKAITKSDIVNEIKLILIMNNQSYSSDKRDQLQQIAVKEAIKRTIKQIEVEKYNLNFSKRDMEAEVERIATAIQVDVETLRNICESNNLDFKILEKNVQTELLWNSLIFQLYKDRLVVNKTEIDESLEEIKEQKERNEYLVSEILIPKVDENQIENTVKEFKDKIAVEGFENVAKTSSISESSLNGGDLGWISEDVLSKDLKKFIINTKIGSVSEPVLLQSGILLFKVRDKRAVKIELNLEQAKNQLVMNEKSKILNIYSITHYDKVRRSLTIKFLQ